MALFPPAAEGERAGSTETDAVREEVRALIMKRMEKGEISRTPEAGLVVGG